MTTLSLIPDVALPTSFSLFPLPYALPVSIKLIPFSRAYFINDSSFVLGAAKQIGLTIMPDLPMALNSGTEEMSFDMLFDTRFIPAIPVNAFEFLTAYVIEYSLSVDNIFIFILIFSYFAVNSKYQHKILFWGILGALIMRGLFIFTGVTLINRFHWIVIIFGGFLVFTGIRMLFQKEPEVDPEKNAVVKFFRRFLPVTKTLHGDKLIITRNRKLYATPLFLVLLILESSDLIFAVDSIPAVLAISKSTFIVYTSNIFAILGLRSLYFAIAGIMGYFRFLKVGLAFVLI